jgi:Na+-transporting methylmalonyl-CoA/oxaloacetate decarboxylase gamma subunit
MAMESLLLRIAGMVPVFDFLSVAAYIAGILTTVNPGSNW